MSRREIGCSARGTILGSAIDGIVPKALCYHRRMTRYGAVLLMFFASAPLARAGGQERPPSAGASSKDPITRARALYNDGKFDGAIAASDQARLVAVRADSADLIAARAYL